MAFTIMENLRGFFNSRPPLVVFMICLGSFAITLITFAYIVKAKELPDPDITEDWNTFLEKFSRLQFCIPHNGALLNNTVPKLSLGEKNTAEVYQSIHEKLGQSIGGSENENTAEAPNSESVAVRSFQRRAVTSDKDSLIEDVSAAAGQREDGPTVSVTSPSLRRQLENVTVDLYFIYIPTPDAKADPHLSYGQFVASVTAHMLKLDVSVKVKGDEQLSVFLSFPQNLTRAMCEEEFQGRCRQYNVHACVTFQGPSRLLPQTQKPSQHTCPSHSDPIFDGASGNAQAGTLVDASSSSWCDRGSRLIPQYTLDDSLTVFLSMHEKSAINLHLMRTSYFLFLMVVTLFCYALVKGRPAKVKSVHIGYEKVSSQA